MDWRQCRQADDDSVYSGELIGGMPLEDSAAAKTVQVEQVAVVVEPVQAEECVMECVEVKVGTLDDAKDVGQSAVILRSLR